MAVVFHHGTPFSAVAYRPGSDGVRARRARLVCWPRPGYAGSTRRPGRAVADVAEDTAQVLDALGHDRFVTMGWSGSRPHAGMGSENIEEFALAAAGGKGFADFLTRQAAQFAALDAEEVAASLRGLVSDLDKAALTVSSPTTWPELWRPRSRWVPTDATTTTWHS